MTVTRTKRGLTRNDVARAVQPEPSPAPPTCSCPDGPVLVGTFRNERLVTVVRHHLRGRPGCCRMPDEPVDVAAYDPPLPARRYARSRPR